MAKTKVTREQWLDLGLRRFGEHGRAGLSVERMAAELGCSKAGFYWYFGSKAEYEQVLFEHWRVVDTTAIIEVSSKARTPVERFETMFHRVVRVRDSADFLFHLRRLGRSERAVKRLVSRTEAERVAFLASQLEALGLPAARARSTAEVLYTYYLGWFERNRFVRLTRAQLDEQFEIVVRIAGLDLEVSESSP